MQAPIRFVHSLWIAGVLAALPATEVAEADNPPVNEWGKVSVTDEPSYSYSQPIYVPSRGQILHWGAVRIGDPGPDLRNDVRAFDWNDGKAPRWVSDYRRAEKLPGLLYRYGKGVYFRGVGEMLDVGTPAPSMIVNAVCFDSQRNQVIYTMPGLMAAYDPAKRTWRDMKATTELYGKELSGGPPVYGAGTCYDPANDEILMFPHWGGRNVDDRATTGRISAHLGTMRYRFEDNRWRRVGDSLGSKEVRVSERAVHQFAGRLSAAADALWAARRSDERKQLLPALAERLEQLTRQAEDDAKLSIAAEQLVNASKAAAAGDADAALDAATAALQRLQQVLKRYRRVQPPPRCATPLVYHPAQQLIVMFGGHTGLVRTDLKDCGRDPEPGALNDTWVYDVTTRGWARVATPTRPPVTRLPKLVYDPASQLMLLVTRSRRFTNDEDRRITLWGLDLSAWRESGEGEWFRLHEQPWPHPMAREWFDVCLDEQAGRLLLCENVREGKMATHHVYAMQLDVRRLKRQAAPKWSPPPPIGPQKIPSDDPEWVEKLKTLPANRWVHTHPPREANTRDWGTAACDPVRGHVYYFGGGHSTYQVNDVAIYAVGANQWVHAAGDHNDWVPPVRWGGVTMGLRGGPHAHHQRNEYVAIDGRMFERHGCISERWQDDTRHTQGGPGIAWFYDLDHGGLWRQRLVETSLGEDVPKAYGVPHLVDPRGYVLGFGGALEPYDGRTTPDAAYFSRYDIYRNKLQVKKIPDPRPGIVYECRPFCYVGQRDQIFFYELVDKSGQPKRQRTWVYDVAKNRFADLKPKAQPPGEPRTVEFIDGQDAVYAVIGDRKNLQEWVYTFADNTWRRLETTRDGPLSFATPYAQTVYVAKYGVLVNMGHASGGTAVMRPDVTDASR